MPVNTIARLLIKKNKRWRECQDHESKDFIKMCLMTFTFIQTRYNRI